LDLNKQLDAAWNIQTRFEAISDRRDPKATVSTLKRFVVQSGKAGAVPA
jgi:alkaline phosphatase D